MTAIRKMSRYLGAAAILALANPAQAMLLDFKFLADNIPGEGGFQPLTISSLAPVFSVDIYGALNGNTSSSFAYLDSGNAGLGVCQNVTSALLCSPSNDDNVDQAGEQLLFEFDTDVIVTSIWFNNNHDADFSLLGDTIDIFGTSYTFTAADHDGAKGWRFDTNQTLDADVLTTVAEYNNEQFYMASLEFSISEPSILGLLGIGLLGLGVATRRRS